MKSVRLLLLLGLLLSTSAIAGEWVPLIPDRPEGSSPEINLISSDAARTEVEVLIPGFYANNTPAGCDLLVPGWSWTSDIGLPALPCGGVLTAQPDGDGYTIDVTGGNYVIFKGLSISSAREPEIDGKGASPVPNPRPWQGSYPAAAAHPGASGFIGALPVASVVVNPFSVDSATGDMTVYSRMTITIRHDRGTTLWPTIALNETLTRRCAAQVVNFACIPVVSSTRGTTGGRADANYLIIAKSTLVSAIQPLADWKERSGFVTVIESVSYPSAQSVKNIITSYSNVQYVLLVGDEGDIPLYNWSYTPGDHWYACTSGGGSPDLFADLSIGRLCGSSSSEITPQVDKILDYEKSPPLDNWLKKTLLVAHGEQYPGKYTECKMQIATAMSSTSDWAVEDYYGGQSGTTNAGVTSRINTGLNLLNYRGHGTTDAWTGWNRSGEYYDNGDVLALNNGDRRPIVFNICCTNANIGSYCLCEAWMDSTGGAVAALGATEPSYTIPNHDYDKKLYDAIFGQGITDIGGAADYATDYIINNHGSLGQTNAKMYLWLGDPSLRVWLNVPGTISASHSSSITAGYQTFGVTVTKGGSALKDATVCCFKDDEVHAVGTTASNGTVSLTISPATSGTMYVTVTHPDGLPYESSVSVGGSTNPYPDIKVNGQNGPITVSPMNMTDITISLDPGNQAGVAYDWWIFGERNSTDTFWWKFPGTWQKSGTAIRAYDGGLVTVSNFLVTSGHMPVGFWTFTFCVDQLNGSYEGTYIDTIDVQSW
jgi:hypothetical protein